MTRYEHAGAANYNATLNADITSGSNSLTLATGGGTGFPTGGTGKFWLVIDPGNSLEEKVLATARSGDSITGLTRAQDNTTAVAHTAGAKVYHIFTAFEADEANAHINTPSRDDHTQYAKKGGDTITGALTSSGASLAGSWAGTPTFTAAVVFSGAPSFTGSPTFTVGTPSFGNGANLGTGTFSGAATFSGNLTFSGGPTITGSATGSYGGELRLGTTGASSAAITTQATGSPQMSFDHRGTTNTGNWVWRNGTNAATTLGQLSSVGLFSAVGGSNIGSGAFTGTTAYLHVIDDGTNGYIQLNGVTNGALVLQSHGTGEVQLGSSTNTLLRMADNGGLKMGFFGTAPAAKPTITNSRGGNAALASLLGWLVTLGLIIDSTTA